MSPSLDKTLSYSSANVNQWPTKIPLGQVQLSDKGSFQRMLDSIRQAFDRPSNLVDVDELWQVLEEYKSNPSDWTKYAHYDPNKYKRNLVDGADKYNVMILSWGPGTKSCIHDHSGSHCFMKILEGELIESRFAWPNGSGEMRKLVDTYAGLDEIIYIHDQVALHQVSNASQTKNAASLHIYIPPIVECRAFDPKTGNSQLCDLTFYSKRGKIVS